MHSLTFRQLATLRTELKNIEITQVDKVVALLVGACGCRGGFVFEASGSSCLSNIPGFRFTASGLRVLILIGVARM